MAQNDRQLPDTVSSIHGGSQFLHDQYDLDGHGNVLAITDVRPGKAGRRSRTMEYDGLDRLTRVTSPMYGAVGAHYAYNVLDDLVQVNIGGTKGRNHHYCYNAQRQLAEVRSGSCGGAVVTRLDFDDQGNLELRREGPNPGVAGQGYRFDFGNRLREVDGIERYRYDGHGRRVLAMQFDVGTTLSQYGLDGKLLFQKGGADNLETDQSYLGSSLLAIREKPVGGGTAVVKYQHTDALGSPVVVTRQNRDIVEETEYEPYGQVLNRPMHDGPGYTGHVEDAATGLVYMQQRYYDPVIGRFLSVDPVTAYDSPITQFNRYRYGNNNPYSFLDPDGRRGRRFTGSNIRGAQFSGSRLYGAPPLVNTGNNLHQSGNDGPDRNSSGSTPLTRQSAFDHYKEGSGTPLRIDFADVDTSEVKASSFGKVRSLIADGPTGINQIDDRLAYSTTGEHRYILGNITLRLQGALSLTESGYKFSGTLKAWDDTYDFNRSSHRGLLGEILTTGGRKTPGVPYDIEIRGSKAITEEGSR